MLKKHSDWIEQVVNWAQSGGLDKLGLPYEPFHIHHPAGRTAKHNKILIGCWWILPIPIRLHDVHSNDPYNVTHHKKLFEAHYDDQRNMFVVMVDDMQSRSLVVPFGRDVIEAVKTWRR